MSATDSLAAVLAIGRSVLIVDCSPVWIKATVFHEGDVLTYDSPAPRGTEPEQALGWALDLAFGLGVSGVPYLLREGSVSSEKVAAICLGADALFAAKTRAMGDGLPLQ